MSIALKMPWMLTVPPFERRRTGRMSTVHRIDCRASSKKLLRERPVLLLDREPQVGPAVSDIQHRVGLRGDDVFRRAIGDQVRPGGRLGVGRAPDG